MAKIQVTYPKLKRVSGTEIPKIELTFNFDMSDKLTGGGTLKIIHSTTEDFATTQEFTPTSFEYNSSGTTWTNMGGNLVSEALILKAIRVPFVAIGNSTVKYLKVTFTSNGTTHHSEVITLSSLMTLSFTTINPKTFGQVRPMKVKVKDKINATVGNTPYTIKVEVTNNALDASPVWENMTTSYTSGIYHTFSNYTKIAANQWAIAVRYTITKANVTDVIEITELTVAFL